MIDCYSMRSIYLIALFLAVAGCSEAPSPTASEQAAAEANVEAMAKEHAEDNAEPSPGAQVAPGREVMGERMAYAEVDDELVYGYFAFPADMLEREHRIETEKAQGSGKPPEIIEKMVTGRVNKFLKEITLLGQPFVKDDSVTVGKLLDGASAKITACVRMEVGEGIEKKVDNFVEEVMAQVKGTS